MSNYAHRFDLYFTVPTDKADWDDLTADELRLGIIKRIASIDWVLHNSCEYRDTKKLGVSDE